jgi:hypothetical protein
MLAAPHIEGEVLPRSGDSIVITNTKSCTSFAYLETLLACVGLYDALGASQ